jgi:hypothetical protein
VAIIGEQQNTQGALIALVNAVAQQLGAERALIGIAKGGRVVLRAISSTASFDARTQAAAAVENLMEEALDQGESVAAPLPESGPFQVNVAHDEHRLDSNLASVFSALLPGRDGPIGVLTVEHSQATGLIDARQAQLVEAVALLAGPVLEDKLELERWFAGRGADFAKSTWARLTERGDLLAAYAALQPPGAPVQPLHGPLQLLVAFDEQVEHGNRHHGAVAGTQRIGHIDPALHLGTQEQAALLGEGLACGGRKVRDVLGGSGPDGEGREAGVVLAPQHEARFCIEGTTLQCQPGLA